MEPADHAREGGLRDSSFPDRRESAAISAALAWVAVRYYREATRAYLALLGLMIGVALFLGASALIYGLCAA